MRDAIRIWHATLLMALALVLASPASAELSRATQKRATQAERELERIQRDLRSVKYGGRFDTRDVRGRTRYDDIRQWSYSSEFERLLESLIAAARSASSDAAAEAALDQAQAVVDEADSRTRQISNYWNQKSLLRWRIRWQKFASANQLPPEPIDAQVLTEEQAMLAQLENGDFAAASESGKEVVSRLTMVIKKAANELVRTRDSAVRVRVSANGCVSGIAVAVSSGYPALDDAAVRVAEYTRYAPASRDDQPIDGEITYMVRFALE